MAPAVASMNQSMPAYANLSVDVIKVLPSDIPYRRTDKNTVIRAAFYRDSAKQIEEAYVDEQSGHLLLPRNKLLELLRTEMQGRIMQSAGCVLCNDSDLFSLRVDSLQAIQVRSFILRHLKLDATKIGCDFVFDFPTLEKMADEILRMQAGKIRQENASVESRMEAMIEKHAVFPRHAPMENGLEGTYIVLIGATGSLGAHAMVDMVAQTSAQRVYCLVRAPDHRSANIRVRQRLRERLVLHNLSSQARSKIVALPAKFADEQPGLGASTYAEIAGCITHLTHFAWLVYFNKGLESFEADCMAGSMNLMEL